MQGMVVVDDADNHNRCHPRLFKHPYLAFLMDLCLDKHHVILDERVTDLNGFRSTQRGFAGA